MVPKTLLLCVGLALLPTAACGQGAAARGDSTATVTRAEFNDLVNSVRANEAAIGNLTSSINNLTAKLGGSSSGNNGLLSANQFSAAGDQATPPPNNLLPSESPPTLEVLAAKIEELENKLEVLDEVQHNHETQLGQIVRKDQDGSYYLQFNTKNPAARKEVRRAIQDAAPEIGYLIVTNRMGSDQFLFVEGDGYRVPANKTRRIPVRRGTISTNLPGQDSVLWTISAPDYQQSIDIRPREIQPATSVGRPVFVPAVYADPWTGISYVVNR